METVKVIISGDKKTIDKIVKENSIRVARKEVFFKWLNDDNDTKILDDDNDTKTLETPTKRTYNKKIVTDKNDEMI